MDPKDACKIGEASCQSGSPFRKAIGQGELDAYSILLPIATRRSETKQAQSPMEAVEEDH